MPKGAEMVTLITLEKPAAYVVGSLAAFWMFERVYFPYLNRGLI